MFYSEYTAIKHTNCLSLTRGLSGMGAVGVCGTRCSSIEFFLLSAKWMKYICLFNYKNAKCHHRARPLPPPPRNVVDINALHVVVVVVSDSAETFLCQLSSLLR